MNEPRNAPVYEELLQWMEEAVEYVNKPTQSPSLEEEGRKLLRLAKQQPAGTDASLVTAKMVLKLRERTNAAMMTCKDVLIRTGGDLDKAVSIINHQ